MAKSSRASSRKSANQKLRVKVFEPVYDARTARLSEKLAQLITEKKPSEVNVMEVDQDSSTQKEQAEESMEIDGGAAAKPLTSSALKRLAAKQRPRKRVSKSQKSIVFKHKVIKGKGDSIGRVGRVGKRQS